MSRMAAVMVLLVGCGGSDGGGDVTPDAADTSFKPLITSSWSLMPGREIYQCATLTLQRDTYLSELRPIIPPGTHHTVLSINTTPSKADNTGYLCAQPFEFGDRLIYGTGVGSKPFVYPDGIGLKLLKGQQLHINLHLYNTSDTAISGVSGVEVREVMAVQHEARLVIWGPSGFNLSPGTYSLTHSCTIPSAINIVSLQPHMHTRGTHLAVTVTPTSGAATTLFDQSYAFETQEHVMIDPIKALQAGDKLTIDCTWDATSSDPIEFGDSSTQEMCFAGISIYPASAAFCP